MLGPVVLGMLVRWWKPKFADAMNQPVRIASMIILAIVIIGAIVANREILFANFGALAGITSLFCALSLTIGFFVPRLFRVERTQAIASAFEIGIHNGTLAIVIAQIGAGQRRAVAAGRGLQRADVLHRAASSGWSSAGRRKSEPSLPRRNSQ